MKLKFLLLPALAASILPMNGAITKIIPGSTWNDTSGKHINAHGGCVVHHEGTFYWFGEDRTGFTSNGVSCYTSTDLYNWKRVGIVFKTNAANDAVTGKCILERPKVIYNDLTGKWVMYSHWENGNDYGEAKVCVAVSDVIDGDYEYVDTFRPNNHDSRDQTVFKDSDGKAYHFGSTDMNTNMNVALLSEDYLSTESDPVTETKILRDLRYEAPAIIKLEDTYFGVFSGCTGWSPNPGHTAMATEPLGYWETGGNFCTDDGASTSYQSQSTFILKVPGHENSYIYMGDRWNQSDIGAKSEYVWLPMSFRSGWPTVQWRDSWDMSAFDNCDRFRRLADPQDGATVRLLDKFSDRWVSTTGNGFFIDNDNDDTNLNFRLESTANPYVWRFIDPESGRYLQSVYGMLSFANRSDSPSQEWRLELMPDGCYRIVSCQDGKVLTVAGSSQRAGSQIFMAVKGATSSQLFGLYFDSEAYDYTAAHIFSSDYRNDVADKIRNQEEFESAVEIVVENNLVISFDRHMINIHGDLTDKVSVDMIEAASGRLVHRAEAQITPGHTSLPLPENMATGVYVIRVKTSTAAQTYKLAI